MMSDVGAPAGRPSHVMLTGLIVAVAAGAFFAGYSANTLAGGGISDQQMDTLISEINSIQVSTANSATSSAMPLVSFGTDDPMKGDQDAELTIIEFSDFQCPFCKRFFDQTLPLLEESYIDTGKVNFVWRDFPMQSHQNAVPAHVAAQCAGNQGQFWKYHDLLFINQAEWSSIPVEAVVGKLVLYADSLGLEADKFETCLTSGATLQKIQDDYQDGAQYGVRGTPTFFIGNEKDGYVLLSGAKPYEEFQAIIELRMQ